MVSDVISMAEVLSKVKLDVPGEDFDQWNSRRLSLQMSKNSMLNNFHIDSAKLTELKAKLIQLDSELSNANEESENFNIDYSHATSKLYQEQLILVMKTFQKTSMDQKTAIDTARRVNWLLFMDPTHTMHELFRLLTKNPSNLTQFTTVFQKCRPCFDLKIIEENPNEDEKSTEVLCSIYVLKKMFHQVLAKESSTELKAFAVLVRQLGRSTVKTTGGKQIYDPISTVSATSIIADILLTVPLNKISADFILNLLNNMFGTGKESHVFVIQWKKQDEAPYLLPRELFCYVLLVYKFLRKIDQNKSKIPFVFRTLGAKLQKENASIKDAGVVNEMLNELLWSEKYTIVKWLGTSVYAVMPEIPEVLYQFLRYECKRNYTSIHSPATSNSSLSASFFESLFEIAISSVDLARELLDEMLSPIFFPDSDAEDLRSIVTTVLSMQTKKKLTIENYRGLSQILELCIQRFDWPMELVLDFPKHQTSLLYDVASKYELLALFGVASFVDVGNQVVNGSSSNASSAALATCFATESNRIISELITRLVNDQTIPRTKICHTSLPLLNSLMRVCENIQLLAKKLEQSPLEVVLLGGLINRIEDFVKQIKTVQEAKLSHLGKDT